MVALTLICQVLLVLDKLNDAELLLYRPRVAVPPEEPKAFIWYCIVPLPLDAAHVAEYPQVVEVLFAGTYVNVGVPGVEGMLDNVVACPLGEREYEVQTLFEFAADTQK